MHSGMCVAAAHWTSPTFVRENKNPFSFLTQTLRYGEAFLSGLVSLGILPRETANFLKPGVWQSLKYCKVVVMVGGISTLSSVLKSHSLVC